MPGDDWANAVKNLTGYPMPDRSTLFQELSGTDGKVPLMNVSVETYDSVTIQSKLGDSVGPNVNGHSYMLAYYTQRTMGSLNLNKITIDFLWNPAERPARPGTPLDNYIFGPLNMLNRLVNLPFSTQDGNYGGLAVDPQNAVKLRTFSDVAGAYDRSYLYFRDQEEVLKQWAESLGHPDADMRGTAADAFAALIRRMQENFKGYKEQLRPEGFSPKNFALYPVYGQGASLTRPGDSLIGAANAVHQAGYELVQAWHNWASNSLSNPMQTLNKLVYDIAIWIQANNIGQVLQDIGVNGDNYWMAPGANFWQDHPTYGNLTQIDAWTRIGNDAIKAWNDFGDGTLVPKGTEQMSYVNNAFISATTALVEPLATRNTSPLGSDNKGGGGDGKGGGSGNQNVDDILNKLGLGGGNGDNGNDGKNGKDGAGGDNKTKIPPPPDLNSLGGDGDNGANGADGKDGNGGLGDPNRFLANVPPPGLNGPGGGGSGLNTPDGLGGGAPGGLPGSTGAGGPGGTGNPRTLVSQPPPGLGLPDAVTPGSGLPGSGTPGSTPGTSRLVQPDLPELGSPGGGLPGGSGLPDSGLPGTTNPDGTTGPNGTTVPLVPGGTRVGIKPPSLQDRDRAGGLPTALPDGSTRTVLPDGSSVTTDPDGTKTTRRPDGTILTEKPDGTKVTTGRDGTTTTEKPDGSKRVLHPGGIVTLTSPDGETSYLGPDGKPLGDRPKTDLTTPPLPSLNPPGLDLPGVSTASGYDTSGGGVTGGGGTLHSGGGNPLQATLPRYEEAGYDVSTDFPDYGVNALSGIPDPSLGGTPNGSPAGSPMMPGMGAGGMGGMGGAGGMGAGGAGDRIREYAGDPAGSPNRMAQAPGTTGSGGTPPYMPPAGGQGGNGQQTQSSDRERANWLAEEEDVWGTEDDVNPAVLGRAEPGTGNGAKNAFMTGESR
ncbi:AAWKG family protein [Streptomyces sp. NPDC090025]|uniref:AAWKG family protein n=1 Tax=Streptomyces sp. NPDC090025 TaxID=3365922 RepID=UPI003836FD48